MIVSSTHFNHIVHLGRTFEFFFLLEHWKNQLFVRYG